MMNFTFLAHVYIFLAVLADMRWFNRNNEEHGGKVFKGSANLQIAVIILSLSLWLCLMFSLRVSPRLRNFNLGNIIWYFVRRIDLFDLI